MAGEKLYITISDNRGGTMPGPSPDKQIPTLNNDNTALMDYYKHQLMHNIKDFANEMVSFGISQIGFLEGNYIEQNKIQMVRKMSNSLVDIAMGALAGAKYGPIGASIGASIMTAKQIFSGLQEIHTQTILANRQNHQIDMLRTRAGLDNLNNDSRTGV